MIGYTLQGRYQITHLLGQGGFSAVYLANDLRLGGRSVAVKVMNLANVPPADQQWTAGQFQQEATFLAGLRHPGVVNVIDYFNEGSYYYLVMEYVQGQTLESYLKQMPGGRLPENQALQLIGQIAAILHYLHTWTNPQTGQPTPIIFRDLKPANIMITPAGQLKLIDFGTARHFKAGKYQDTISLGTPGYAAPEQYGKGQSDARADIYGLAVLSHELLTGYDPTSSPMYLPPVQQLNPYIRPNISAAITRALNVDPNYRFNTVMEYQAALTGAGFAGGPTIAIPGAVTGPSNKPYLIAGAVALAVIVIIGLFAVFNGDETIATPVATSAALLPSTETVTATAPPAATATPTAEATATSTKQLPTATPSPQPTATPTTGPLANEPVIQQPTTTATSIPRCGTASGLAVTSLTLINAVNDGPISAYSRMTSDVTIDLSSLPNQRLNLQAHANGGPASVLFIYDGVEIRPAENTAPYAMHGDVNGNYYDNRWAITTGAHTIQAIPYTGRDASGQAGSPCTITITFVP
jgi:hypothetical protein